MRPGQLNDTDDLTILTIRVLGLSQAVRFDCWFDCNNLQFWVQFWTPFLGRFSQCRSENWMVIRLLGISNSDTDSRVSVQFLLFLQIWQINAFWHSLNWMGFSVTAESRLRPLRTGWQGLAGNVRVSQFECRFQFNYRLNYFRYFRGLFRRRTFSNSIISKITRVNISFWNGGNFSFLCNALFRLVTT